MYERENYITHFIFVSLLFLSFYPFWYFEAHWTPSIIENVSIKTIFEIAIQKIQSCSKKNYDFFYY